MVSQNENDIFGLKYMYEQFKTYKYFSELVYMWEYSTKLIQRITFMAKKSIYIGITRVIWVVGNIHLTSLEYFKAQAIISKNLSEANKRNGKDSRFFP